MKIIVFDNHSLGAARRESRVTGLPNCQTDMRNCNWAATTRATGLAALEADSPDNPEKTLRNTPAGGGMPGSAVKANYCRSSSSPSGLQTGIDLNQTQKLQNVIFFCNFKE